MRILAVDYGRRKIGLALATTPIAEPYDVVRFKRQEEGLKRIVQVVQSTRISRLVVGISEGQMGEEARRFGEKLGEKLGVQVVFQDETLSTKEAEVLAIKAGIKRKKRRELSDAYSATLILQAYLDSS